VLRGRGRSTSIDDHTFIALGPQWRGELIMSMVLALLDTT